MWKNVPLLGKKVTLLNGNKVLLVCSYELSKSCLEKTDCPLVMESAAAIFHDTDTPVSLPGYKTDCHDAFLEGVLLGWLGSVEPGREESLWARGVICLLTFAEGGSWIIFLLVPFKYGTSLQVSVPFKSSAGSPEQHLCHAHTKSGCFTGGRLIERWKEKARRTWCISSTPSSLGRERPWQW